MNVVIIIIAGLGSIGLVLIGLFLIMLGWSEFQDGRLERRRKKEYLLVELGVRRLGTELLQSHHWFSEDHRAMNLIRALGDSLSKYGRFEVDSIRLEWREENNRTVIRKTREARI